MQVKKFRHHFFAHFSTDGFILHCVVIVKSVFVFCIWKIRCWEVKENGQTIPKAQQSHTGPILDCCWHDVSGLLYVGVYNRNQEPFSGFFIDQRCDVHCTCTLFALSLACWR